MNNYDYYLKADVEKYLGEWIAISNNKIVSHGKEFKKVINQAKKIYPNSRPLMARIPNKEAMIL